MKRSVFALTDPQKRPRHEVRGLQRLDDDMLEKVMETNPILLRTSKWTRGSPCENSNGSVSWSRRAAKASSSPFDCDPIYRSSAGACCHVPCLEIKTPEDNEQVLSELRKEIKKNTSIWDRSYRHTKVELHISTDPYWLCKFNIISRSLNKNLRRNIVGLAKTVNDVQSGMNATNGMLTRFNFVWEFNSPVSGLLPEGIQSLTFQSNFYHPLFNLPKSLQALDYCLGSSQREQFMPSVDELPPGLKELTVNFRNDGGTPSLDTLPQGLRKLTIHTDNYYRPSGLPFMYLDKLPQGLKELHIDVVDSMFGQYWTTLPQTLEKLYIVNYQMDGAINPIMQPLHNLPKHLRTLSVEGHLDCPFYVPKGLRFLKIEGEMHHPIYLSESLRRLIVHINTPLVNPEGLPHSCEINYIAGGLGIAGN